jgi:DNA-binding transcriptional LysR family regulator
LTLAREFPDLEVLTSTLDPERAVSELRAGQLDIAVSYEWRLTPRPRNPGIDRHALFTEPMVLLLPPGHPAAGSVHLLDFAAEKWCLAQDEEHGRLVFEHVAHARGFEPRVSFESDHFRAIASAVEAGIGIGLVPLLTDLRGVDVIVKPLDEPRLDRRVFAAVRPGSGESPVIGAVLSALSAPACALMSDRVRQAVPHATPERATDLLDHSDDLSEGSIAADSDHVPPDLRDEWYMGG